MAPIISFFEWMKDFFNLAIKVFYGSKKKSSTYIRYRIFFIILLAAVMTWIIPPGSYIEETVLTDSGAQTQMRFYYQQDLPAAEQQLLNAEPQTWQVFSALFKGFVKQSNIIIFYSDDRRRFFGL